MKFIKRKESKVVVAHYWDYWDLQNSYTAVVTCDDGLASIFVENENNNFTEKVLTKLQAERNYPYITKGYGIDAVFIECPKDKLEEVLSKIEDICKTLQNK